MTDRPIIFSAPMVRALLEGRKTQTRCLAKITAIMGNKVAIKSPDERLIELSDGEFRAGICHYESTGGLSGPYSLPAAVGDRLWVRETWQVAQKFTDVVEVRYRASERASHTEFVEQIPIAIAVNASVTFQKWRSPIHMPRWASRLTLTVTDVRVQRLQELNRGDAMEEGCPFPNMRDGDDPRQWFADLWNSIHGPDAWPKNPWVAALTFTVERRNINAVDSDGEKK